MPSRSAIPLVALVCPALVLGGGASATEDDARGPSPRIEGRVLDADGWPLTGARVYVFPDPGTSLAEGARRPLLETASDRDGHFVLEGLRPGTYHIDIEAPDHQAAHVGVHLPEGGGPPAPLEVHLWPVTTAPRPARGRTDAEAEPASAPAVAASAAAPRSAPPPPAPVVTPPARSSEAIDDQAAAGDERVMVAESLDEEVARALAAGQVPRALALLEGIPEERAADADLFFQVGDALLRSGETAQAARVLGEALDRDPDHLGARYARALARLGTGQLDGAREDFQRVVQLQPDGPFADKARAALSELRRPAVRTTR